MHDSDFERENDTALTIAFNKAGFFRIDPEHTVLPLTFEREAPAREDPPQATSITAATCDMLALFAGAPGRDEPDPRDVWDKDEACFALEEALRLIIEGVTAEGTQLHDEREPLLWGFANMLHRQMEILHRTVDRIVPEQQDLERDQDGSEVMALKLQTVTERAQNLAARADAFQHLRDISADAYLTVTGNVWHPKRGSRAPRAGAVNAAVIDARDFRRARDARQQDDYVPAGTLVAVAGGKGVSDADAIWTTLDRAREKYPDMVLLHGGGPGAEKIASSWADKNEVHQIVFRPDWKTHDKAAPFRRNDEMLNLLPKGIIAFPGSGITGNLVDKARRLGIPVHHVRA